MMLTQARLKELLRYDPDTGIFRWKVRTSNRVKVGDAAGWPNKGYVLIKVDGEVYMAHRSAWLYQTGQWPAEQTDHRNGIGDDNRWGNLREATCGQNQQNRSKHSNNTSGLIGVYWVKNAQRWRAQICVDGRQRYLGYFHNKESAHEAYLVAKAKLHTFNPTVRKTA